MALALVLHCGTFRSFLKQHKEQEMDLWQLFQNAWTSPAVTATSKNMAAAYQHVQRCYAEPHRRHHVWYHVEKGMELIQEFRDALTHPDLVVLAYFYHDQVYDVHRQDNEEQSAGKCGVILREAGARLHAIYRIHALIMDTAHTHGRSYDHLESQLIVSVDLATLGFAPSLFQRYSENIYAEYVEHGGVAPREFLKGQNEFFKSMLARPLIYPFAPLRQRYEAQARENLTRAIREYEAKTAVS